MRHANELHGDHASLILFIMASLVMTFKFLIISTDLTALCIVVQKIFVRNVH
jgi:hypothetical protein